MGAGRLTQGWSTVALVLTIPIVCGRCERRNWLALGLDLVRPLGFSVSLPFSPAFDVMDPLLPLEMAKFATSICNQVLGGAFSFLSIELHSPACFDVALPYLGLPPKGRRIIPMNLLDPSISASSSSCTGTSVRGMVVDGAAIRECLNTGRTGRTLTQILAS